MSILVGQKLDVNVQGLPPGTGDNVSYAWTIDGGAPFTEYKPTNAKADPPVQWVSKNEPATFCYFGKDSGTGRFTVTCQVTLASGVQTFNKQVQVWKPDVDTKPETATIGSFALLREDPTTGRRVPDNVNPELFRLFGPTAGFVVNETVLTPAPFRNQDVGQWHYTQLVKGIGWEVFGGVRVDDDDNGKQGVDGAFVYPGLGPWPALTTAHQFRDSPGFDFRDPQTGQLELPDRAHLEGTFATYVMYAPPGGGKYVPLAVWDWKCAGECQRGNPNWLIYLNTKQKGGPSTFPAFPTWKTQVHAR